MKLDIQQAFMSGWHCGVTGMGEPPPRELYGGSLAGVWHEARRLGETHHQAALEASFARAGILVGDKRP